MISAGLGPPEMAMPILLMLCLWFVGPGQHAQTVDASAGHRSAQGARASSRRAISSTTASCPNGATICTPIGRPSGCGCAGHADARQSGGIDPGTKHALGRGRQARRRFILGAPGRRGGGGENQRVVLSPRGGHIGTPGGECIQSIDIRGGRYRETAFSRRRARCRRSPHASDPGTAPRSAPPPPR